MFSLLSASTLLLAVASSVSGLAVVRRTTPSSYNENHLEAYAGYHTRYLALNCQSQHGSAFFQQCCHPLKKSEDMSSLPAQCQPSTPASSAPSGSPAQPAPTATTSTTPEDDNDLPECDDEGDDGEDNSDDSGAPAAAPATPAAAPDASPAATPDATPDAAPDASQPAPNQAAAGDANSTPAPSASSSSDSPAPTSSSQAPAPTGAPSGGNVVTGGFGTFFFQNGVAGACGTVHADSDSVVAMDSATYGNGELCGKQVQITNVANGKTVTATVADECPTCNNAQSIDMSTGAFDQIADEATGLINISWILL
jgi:hypothetical protein